MKKIIALLLTLSFPTLGDGSPFHRSVPGQPSQALMALPANTNTPANGGGVAIRTENMGTVFASIAASGSCPGANCTVQAQCSNDQWATQKQVQAHLITNGNVASTSSPNITVAGDYAWPTLGFRECALVYSSYTSGTATVRIDADPSNYFSTTGSGTSNENITQINGSNRFCDKQITFTTQGTTAIVKQIAESGTTSIYVCSIILFASTAVAGIDLSWYSGSGANCSAGTHTQIGGKFFTTPTAAPANNANYTWGPVNPGLTYTLAAGDGLCTQQSATANATTLAGTIFYAQY